jgi:transcription-repair coupling factor (superfamily II helicase)
VLARPYGVTKIDAGPKLMNLSFSEKAPVDAQRIVELVQKNRAIKLAGNHKLRIERAIDNPADRAHYLRDLLRALGQPAAVRV